MTSEQLHNYSNPIEEGAQDTPAEQDAQETSHLIEEAPKDVSHLTEIGDYQILKGEGKEPQLVIVTKIKHGREWSRGNPGLSDPHLRAPVSYPTKEPIVNTFTKQTFAQELQNNPLLMIRFRQGSFDELTKEGFTGDLAEADQNINHHVEALKLIDQVLEEKDSLTSGSNVYSSSRALLAKAILDPENVQDTVQKAQTVGEIDWIPSFVPSIVTVGLFGTSDEKREAFLLGKEWVSGEDQRRIKIIAGWSILAASASTDEEKSEAYQLVLEDINTEYIDMASNVTIAAAILASDEQKNERYLEAKKEYEESEYWAIEGGNLIAMAILAPEGEERSKVYQISRERLKEGYDSRYTKKDMLVMALTAQTEEEKTVIFRIAETYSNTNDWSNILNGWANISLGILGCDNRELAIKSVAGLLESDD